MANLTTKIKLLSIVLLTVCLGCSISNRSEEESSSLDFSETPSSNWLRGISSTNIHGRDDRIAMTSSDYPWSAIGRLEVGNGHCTGSLVGVDLVLTNAHCVVDEHSKTLTTNKIWFRPNYQNGSAPDAAFATRVWLGTNNPDNSRHGDWAILRINKPLGIKYGYMGWRILNFSNPESMADWFVMAGYSADFLSGETAGLDLECSITEEIPQLGFLFHNCDTNPGSSGGPIFAQWANGGFQIAGLNAAHRQCNNQNRDVNRDYNPECANIAVKVTEFALQLRQLRNESGPILVGMGSPPGSNSLLVYENPTYGLRIKYPTTWKVEEINRKNALIKTIEVAKFVSRQSNTNSPVEVTIIIEQSSKNLSLEEFKNKAAEEIQGFSSYRIKEIANSSLGNESAYKIVYSGSQGGNNLQKMQVFTLKDSRNAYVITYTAEANKFDRFLKEVEGIINSFEFL